MIPISFKRHCFPPTIIQHAFWLYARFTLSFRDAADLLAEHGIVVSSETVRRSFLKFGPLIAGHLRCSCLRASARWNLDEMVISIRGRRHWLWRAADDESEVLDFLVQPQRCARSARRLLRKLLTKQSFAPQRIITDKLKSYAVAICEERLSAVHDQGLRENNRAENSHQPVRRREQKLQRFKPPGSSQRFQAIDAAVYNSFYVQHHLLSRHVFRQLRLAHSLAEIKVGLPHDEDHNQILATGAVNVPMPSLIIGWDCVEAIATGNSGSGMPRRRRRTAARARQITGRSGHASMMNEIGAYCSARLPIAQHREDAPIHAAMRVENLTRPAMSRVRQSGSVFYGQSTRSGHNQNQERRSVEPPLEHFGITNWQQPLHIETVPAPRSQEHSAAVCSGHNLFGLKLLVCFAKV